MIQLKLKLMGIFSEYFNDIEFIKLKNNSTINDLKKYLFYKLKKIDVNLIFLLKNSVFFNGKILLNDYYVINLNDIIYVLPPISGG